MNRLRKIKQFRVLLIGDQQRHDIDRLLHNGFFDVSQRIEVHETIGEAGALGDLDPHAQCKADRLAGRLVVVVLMFIGRVGPLTLFSAFSAKPERVRVDYPAAEISVG